MTSINASSFSRVLPRPPSPKSRISRNSAPRISAPRIASRSRVEASPRVPISPRVKSTIPNRRPLALSVTSVPAQVSSMSSECAAIARTSTGMNAFRFRRTVGAQVDDRCALRRALRGFANRRQGFPSIGEHRHERGIQPLGGSPLRQEHRLEPLPPLHRGFVLPLGRLPDSLDELLDLIRDLPPRGFERADERRIGLAQARLEGVQLLLKVPRDSREGLHL